MKFTFLLLALVIVGTMANLYRHKKAKHHAKKHKKQNIPIGMVVSSTPKGGASQMKDHFGYPAGMSPYGPKDEIEGKTVFQAMGQDGKVERVVVDNDKLNDVNMANSKCLDLISKPHYKVCATITDCDICSNMAQCGWCGASKKCVPGNMNGAVCPGDCISGWVLKTFGCTGKVVSGRIDNISTETTKLTEPEMTTPKVKVVTTTHNMVNQHSDVVVGHESQVHKITSTDSQGHVHDTLVQREAPIVSHMTMQIPLNTKEHVDTLDLKSGEILDNQYVTGNDVKTHGTRRRRRRL